MATFTWNGQLGTDWSATSGLLTNWDGPGMAPIPGDTDTAIISKDATITGGGAAGEIQITGATVTLASGGFEAGFDGNGGLLVDQSATLVVASGASMTNRGSIDIVGATQNGSLEIQPGAGFDDLGMVVGEGPGSIGDVTADSTIFEVVQSAPGAADGVLTIGFDGDGSVDVSGNSLFFAASVIVGQNADSTGTLTVDDSTWGGANLTIGSSGLAHGTVTIENGSSVAVTDAAIGAMGELDVTGVGGVVTNAMFDFLTIAFGTVTVSGGGEVNVVGQGVQGAVDIGTTVLGLGTINGNVVVEQNGVLDADQPLDGTLTINGNIAGAGKIEPVRTLEVNGVVDAATTIQFGAPAPGDGVLQLDVPRGEDGTIVGFAVGNEIDVKGLVYTDAVFTPGVSGNPGVLTLSGGTDAPLALKVEGDYAPNAFLATPLATETLVTLQAVCYCRGTRILTDQGEVPVEELKVGNLVKTLSGGFKSIVWIGFGRDLVTRANKLARPIVVRRDALADGVPVRDLYLTHGHALYFPDQAGVLVPVEHLVNHASIAWDETARVVEYFHIELDEHDVIFADGAPAETYYDAGNRALFHNSRPRSAAASAATIFAPVLHGGDIVGEIWTRLWARAGGQIACETTNDPDLHLVVDECRHDPVSSADGVYTFALVSPPASGLRLRSRSAVPSLLGDSRHEHRQLGIAIRQLIMHQAGILTALDCDAPLFRAGGAYAPENGCCWTDGELILPASLFAHLRGAFNLLVHTKKHALRYPIASATEAASRPSTGTG